jgi:adenylate kinase
MRIIESDHDFIEECLNLESILKDIMMEKYEVRIVFAVLMKLVMEIIYNEKNPEAAKNELLEMIKDCRPNEP